MLQKAYRTTSLARVLTASVNCSMGCDIFCTFLHQILFHFHAALQLLQHHTSVRGDATSSPICDLLAVSAAYGPDIVCDNSTWHCAATGQSTEADVMLKFVTYLDMLASTLVV